MAELLRPGVFVFETSFRGKPIEGVATSTAGFVGRAQAGPEGDATLVTSFTQFTREFGQPYSNPQNMGEYLGHAVRSFFSNGGLRAYIVRVLGAGAAAATVAADDGTVLLLASTVRVTGASTSLPLNTLRAVDVGAALAISTRPSPSVAFTPKATVTVTSYDAVRDIAVVTGLTVGTTLDPANTYAVVVGKEPATGAAAPSFTALDRGANGNSLAVQVRPNDLPPVRFATTKLLRAKPVVTATGPAVALATSVTLTDPQIRMVRIGDTLTFDNGLNTPETKTITTIGTTSVTYTGVAGTIAAGSQVGILKRTIAPVFDITAGTSAGAIVYTVNADIVFPAAGPVSLPHGLAAILQPGDTIVGSTAGVAGTVKGVVTAFTRATTASWAGGLVSTYAGGNVFLTNTAKPTVDNPFPRLVVTDVSALNSPARINLITPNTPSPEPVVVSDGVGNDPAKILFVDVATSTIVVAPTSPLNTAQVWLTVNTDNWVSAEDLEVAKQGDSTLYLASVASFYKGGILRFDDGATPWYSVAGLVDPVARTVQFMGGIDVNNSTGYVDVDPTPANRAAYVSTLEIDVLVYQSGVVVESFTNLSWNPDPTADSFRKYYFSRINDANTGSAFIKVIAPATPALLAGAGLAPAGQPNTPDGQPLALLLGDDGVAPINIDIIGADNGPGNRTGIQSLIERDDIAIVAVPGVTDVAVQDELITQCETLKYRFAVLDGIPHTSDVSAIQAHRNNYDTKYAAYYEPWIETLDLTTGNTLIIPPSGAIVGIYARVDNDRGVFKAPANEVVSDIFDLEFQFGNGEQEVLNPVGVNLIRTFTGRGIRVWGARCITSDQEWKYINVRRLFIFLEHSIDIGTQWVVFEPNNEALWARVVSTISSFLVGVWKTGAFMGTKPEDAFFVRCDRTTMTQDDIDNGRLIVLIGIAPTFPAEFVVFQIGQFTASSPS